MVATVAHPTIESAINDELIGKVRGRVIRPEHPEYDDARAIWNGMIDRRPAAIVQCSGTADVVEAVNFAREHDLALSIRGGGHNVAGNAMNDGGLVIDLSQMRGVRVNPEARTVRVQGGATWADVDRETQLFGLATPGGVISDTGVAGLTLHGGWGWLRRKLGYSLDNLLSIDIVTANGEIRTASETENPDLFWAIRGAGSNFGVVTSFEFRTHPVGPMIFLAAAAYPTSDAISVIRATRTFMETAPDDISVNILFWNVPAVEMFPSELHGKAIVIPAAVHCGPVEVAEKALMPLRELGTPLLDLSHAEPYTELQQGFDWAIPKGWLYYWKSLYLNSLGDDVIDDIVGLAEQKPSTQSVIELWQLGGAPSRIPAAATAFGKRDAPFLLSFDTSWTDPADSDRCISWTRDAWTSMQRHSDGGLYLNFPGFGEEQDALVRAGYGANVNRLSQIKLKYDPTNLFRMNLNIKPAN